MYILEILKYLIPTSGVVMIAYWLINRPIKMEKIKREHETQVANYKTVTPPMLNAYERLVLFLERTSPDQLLNRELDNSMSCFDFQIHLLRVIREEFQHNVAQQVYVSPEAWQAVVVAKDNIVQLINIAASQVKGTDKAYVLAQIILRTYSEATDTPTKNAIDLLKMEIGRLLK